MAGEAPRFWWNEQQKLARHLLSPVSAIYGYFARKTMERKDIPSVGLPVLCIGNFTLGGTGKTPVAIMLVNIAKSMGRKPGIVSRGYGGKIKHAHIVNPAFDKADNVGDEPILLAQHAPVAIGRDRFKAAELLKLEGCDLILMDDGFQSRRLIIDYSLVVVDSLRGVGNGAVFPAGPLRAPLETQLAFADSILVIGNGIKKNEIINMAENADKPLCLAKLVPSASQPVADKRFLAFAGIGNPEKFFNSIIEMNGIIEEKRIYADHHFYTENELDSIQKTAIAKNLVPATTAKDFVRLKNDKSNKLIDELCVFDVSVSFEKQDFCQLIIQETLECFKKRSTLSQ